MPTIELHCPPLRTRIDTDAPGAVRIGYEDPRLGEIGLSSGNDAGITPRIGPGARTDAVSWAIADRSPASIRLVHDPDRSGAASPIGCVWRVELLPLRVLIDLETTNLGENPARVDPSITIPLARTMLSASDTLLLTHADETAGEGPWAITSGITARWDPSGVAVHCSCSPALRTARVISPHACHLTDEQPAPWVELVLSSSGSDHAQGDAGPPGVTLGPSDTLHQRLELAFDRDPTPRQARPDG